MLRAALRQDPDIVLIGEMRDQETAEIGLRLYEHGRQIRNELEAARETVTTLGQTLQGRVRLSVPSGYGQLVMAPWLIDFKRAYPGIVLDVVFENRVVDLMRDEVDIAVRVMSEPPDNLVARDMGSVRYVACATPALRVMSATRPRPSVLSACICPSAPITRVLAAPASSTRWLRVWAQAAASCLNGTVTLAPRPPSAIKLRKLSAKPSNGARRAW